MNELPPPPPPPPSPAPPRNCTRLISTPQKKAISLVRLCTTLWFSHDNTTGCRAGKQKREKSSFTLHIVAGQVSDPRAMLASMRDAL